MPPAYACVSFANETHCATRTQAGGIKLRIQSNNLAIHNVLTNNY